MKLAKALSSAVRKPLHERVARIPLKLWLTNSYTQLGVIEHQLLLCWFQNPFSILQLQKTHIYTKHTHPNTHAKGLYDTNENRANTKNNKTKILHTFLPKTKQKHSQKFINIHCKHFKLLSKTLSNLTGKSWKFSNYHVSLSLPPSQNFHNFHDFHLQNSETKFHQIRKTKKRKTKLTNQIVRLNWVKTVKKT